MDLRAAYDKWCSINLMLRIIVAIILGVLLGVAIPNLPYIELLGTLFVGGLKAVAPLLVFFLVISALSQTREKLSSKFRLVIALYLISTIISAIVAVSLSYIDRVHLTLSSHPLGDSTLDGLQEIVYNLVYNMIENPVSSVAYGNYLSIIFWSVLFGMILKKYGNDTVIGAVSNISDVINHCIRIIIEFAPFGLFGIMYQTISENSLSIFGEYGQLIIVLVAAMCIVMFVTNPILVYLTTRRNPYPLLFRCLRGSAITAFFTRSSAANIPVNMELAEDMKLDKDLYSVSVPLGATINMNGAAITITIMTMAAAWSVGIDVPFPLAIVLCIIAALGACGASGVTGGSLLLIPMACALFGISDDIAMEVVAIGFVIGVVQDSLETALNSSSDILFTAAADIHDRPDGEYNI